MLIRLTHSSHCILHRPVFPSGSKCLGKSLPMPMLFSRQPHEWRNFNQKRQMFLNYLQYHFCFGQFVKDKVIKLNLRDALYFIHFYESKPRNKFYVSESSVLVSDEGLFLSPKIVLWGGREGGSFHWVVFSSEFLLLTRQRQVLLKRRDQFLVEEFKDVDTWVKITKTSMLLICVYHLHSSGSYFH